MRDQKGFPSDILLNENLASELIRANPVNAALRTVVVISMQTVQNNTDGAQTA